MNVERVEKLPVANNPAGFTVGNGFPSTEEGIFWTSENWLFTGLRVDKKNDVRSRDDSNKYVDLHRVYLCRCTSSRHMSRLTEELLESLIQSC